MEIVQKYIILYWAIQKRPDLIMCALVSWYLAHMKPLEGVKVRSCPVPLMLKADPVSQVPCVITPGFPR